LEVCHLGSFEIVLNSEITSEAFEDIIDDDDDCDEPEKVKLKIILTTNNSFISFIICIFMILKYIGKNYKSLKF
jgi:hypothetical protein